MTRRSISSSQLRSKVRQAQRKAEADVRRHFKREVDRVNREIRRKGGNVKITLR